MDRIHVANIDLEVSALCLGIPEIGVRQMEKEAHRLLDFWVELGGNFLDTARVYSDWVPGEKQRSERILGDWLKATGLRKQMVLGTKGGHPPLQNMKQSRLSPAELSDDLEASLTKLGTDHVDLWWLHRDDESLPVESIVDACDSFVGSGRVKALGVANWAPDRIRKANAYATRAGKAGFVATQFFWNLGSRHYRGLDPTMQMMDDEAERLHESGNLVAMPFSSQAGGFFTQWLDGDSNARANAEKSGYATRENFQSARLAGEIAKRNGVPVGAVVLAYLRAHPFRVVPIVGCGTIEHLTASVKALDFALPAADFDRLRELAKRKESWWRRLPWLRR